MEGIGTASKVSFQVVCCGADVLGGGRDDPMQVVAQVACLFRPVECSERLVREQGQFFLSHAALEVVDAVGEDAVPYAGSGLEQFVEVAVKLGDVAGNWCPVMQDVSFELDAGVVDVQVHLSRVSLPWLDLGRHFGRSG